MGWWIHPNLAQYAFPVDPVFLQNTRDDRLFRTPDKDVHVHIYSDGCPEITRNLTFRDRLRRNANDRTRYEQTERQLATQDWSDMNAYAQAKTDVIEDVIAASQAAGEISH